MHAGIWRYRAQSCLALLCLAWLLTACTTEATPVSPALPQQTASEPVLRTPTVPFVSPTPFEGALQSASTPVSRAGPSVSPTPVAPEAAPSPTQTALTLPAATLTQSPEPTTLPSVGPTAIPRIVVDGPLLVDGEAQRLYARGTLDGEPRTLVLGAQDGSLLGSYADVGALGLDAAHQRLYLDDLAQGLTILDADRLQPLALVALPLPPQAEESRTTLVPPLADELSGHVLAFRGHVVYRVDPNAPAIVDQIAFENWQRIGCSGPQSDLFPAIEAAQYDPAHGLLYLQYLSYACTPWLGQTIVTYDLAHATVAEIFGDTQPRVLAHDGCLYGTSFYRLGIGYRWKHCLDDDSFYSEHWSGGSPGFALDVRRDRLYEATRGPRDETHLRAYDSETMALEMAIALPHELARCRLAGYDSVGDRLYLLSDEGELRILPVDSVPQPAPEPLAPADPPQTAVRELRISEDGTLYGLWTAADPAAGDCSVLGQPGGLLYVSRDGGRTWGLSLGGLQGACAQLSALAVGPGSAGRRTLLAGIVGMGVFRSGDDGQLWLPSAQGLHSMSVKDLLLSPDYGADRLAFAHTTAAQRGAEANAPRSLYRSADGGTSWQALALDALRVAVSPEFHLDGSMLALGRLRAGDPPGLFRSTDRGDSWTALPDPPGNGDLTLLSLAPLYAQWQVAFAFVRSGALYRSGDGGASWTPVLSTSGSRCQMAFAPDIEENRPIYLLAHDEAWPAPTQGALYRSRDGGQHFVQVALPDNVLPTALAISPGYRQDGLIYIGTADGRVLPLRGEVLAPDGHL